MEQKYIESLDKKIMKQEHQILSHLNECARPTNIARVSELICSQDDDLGTRKFCEIQRETGISRSTVRRIAKDDLKLKIFRRREVQQLSDSDAKKRLQARIHVRIKQRMTVD